MMAFFDLIYVKIIIAKHLITDTSVQQNLMCNPDDDFIKKR